MSLSATQITQDQVHQGQIGHTGLCKRGKVHRDHKRHTGLRKRGQGHQGHTGLRNQGQGHLDRKGHTGLSGWKIMEKRNESLPSRWVIHYGHVW